MVNVAFQKAMAGKPGPVYLDFPGDILYEKIDQLVTNKDFLVEWDKMKADKIDFHTLISRAVKLIK